MAKVSLRCRGELLVATAGVTVGGLLAGVVAHPAGADVGVPGATVAAGQVTVSTPNVPVPATGAPAATTPAVGTPVVSVPAVTTPTAPSAGTPPVKAPPLPDPSPSVPSVPAPDDPVAAVEVPPAQAPAVPSPSGPAAPAPAPASPDRPAARAPAASGDGEEPVAQAASGAAAPSGRPAAAPAGAPVTAGRGRVPERGGHRAPAAHVAVSPLRVRRALARYDACLPTLPPDAEALLRERAGQTGAPPQTLTHLAAERRTSAAAVRSRIRHAVRRLRQAADRGACTATPVTATDVPLPGAAAPAAITPADAAIGDRGAHPVRHSAAATDGAAAPPPEVARPSAGARVPGVGIITDAVSSLPRVALWALQLAVLLALIATALTVIGAERLDRALWTLRGGRRRRRS